MERFILYLGKSKRKIQEAKGLKRKHQTAIVNCSLADSLDVISSHNLQVLFLRCSNDTYLSRLVEVLGRLPSLKVLHIDLHSLIDDVTGSGDFNKIQIALKEVCCPVEIMQLFDCSTVKIFIISLSNPLDAKRKEIVIDFLRQQRKLEALGVVGDNLNDFFTIPEILELKCALKRLKIDCERTEFRFLHFDMLIRFLDRHKKTLTSLKLNFCTDPSFGIKIIHTFVLENLTNLKLIEFGHILNDGDDDDNREHDFPFDELPLATQITKNLNSIDVDLTTSENGYKRFFAMFSNLKYLGFNSDGENYTLFPSSLSEINVNLVSLKLWGYGKSSDDRLNAIVYFPNLKELIVDEFSDDDMCDFINQHSNTLEKITFEPCYCLTYQTTKAILNCVNLKYLEISCYKANACFVNMFNEIALRSRPFELKMSYYPYRKSFIFPEDKAIWNKELGSLQKKIYKHCCPVQ